MDEGFARGGAAPTGGAHTLLRVERGRATDAELAAITVVLFSLLADQGADASVRRSPDVPRWRPERVSAAYSSPYSWR
ncbi:acyl-CoA carboxylase subunit epsilon [Streptomyces sp. NPDC048514]|uniref:acyl-CoA carboxylase subunit epsilon n=1 Tax=Streptomyces sp. NPDC048514 TaxID=3365564 RepID=UPI003723C0C2